MSLELYSHPNKKLFTHLKNVADAMVAFLESVKVNFNELVPDEHILREVVYLIGISHDFGKATKHFQKYILGDESVKKKLRGKEETRHSFISSLFAMYLTEIYLKEKDIPDFTKKLLPLFSYLVVRRHHSNLKAARSDIIGLKDAKYAAKKLNDMDQESVESLYRRLLSRKSIAIFEFSFNGFKDWVNVLNRRKIHILLYVLDEISRQKSLNFFFFVNLIYSLLLDADKKDAAGLVTQIPRKDFDSDLIDKYKKIKFDVSSRNEGINRLREEIYHKVLEKLNEIDIERDRLLTLEAFTGAGKTLTALSFALKLRKLIKQKNGITPRVIYALPFLTIIDQNSHVIEEVFNASNIALSSDLFLKHHHLADIEYTVQKNTATTFESEFIQDPLEIEKALLLIESWESELIITTFVQFFHSIITNRNRALKKFHNIINSIIILDEIQSIPYRYWPLLHDALKFLAEKYNTWIILMTATMPLLFHPNETTKLLTDNEKYYRSLDRIEMHVNLQAKNLETFKEELLSDIKSNPKKSFLIILNTINSSRDVFNFLKESLDASHVDITYLSTAVPPIERYKRITAFQKNNGKQKILVSTQLVEAGVDISADIVYRDFAPLDSIIQSAGRCNRNNTKGKGIVKVVYLIDSRDDIKHARPFSHYIYDSFLLNKTVETFQETKNTTINEPDIYLLIQKYYHKVKDFMSNEKSRKILDTLYNLEFKNTYEFQLIEEKGTTYDVFIELNDEAKKLKEKFIEILSLSDRGKRRQEWLKIKNEFYQYVVSIRSEDVLSLPLLGNTFFIVENEALDEWYDHDTGFGRKIKTLIF